jgi:hypothetical protein
VTVQAQPFPLTRVLRRPATARTCLVNPTLLRWRTVFLPGMPYTSGLAPSTWVAGDGRSVPQTGRWSSKPPTRSRLKLAPGWPVKSLGVPRSTTVLGGALSGRSRLPLGRRVVGCKKDPPPSRRRANTLVSVSLLMSWLASHRVRLHRRSVVRPHLSGRSPCERRRARIEVRHMSNEP